MDGYASRLCITGSVSVYLNECKFLCMCVCVCMYVNVFNGCVSVASGRASDWLAGSLASLTRIAMAACHPLTSHTYVMESGRLATPQLPQQRCRFRDHHRHLTI